MNKSKIFLKLKEKNIENFKNKKKKNKKKDNKNKYKKKNNDDWDDYFDNLKEERRRNSNITKSYYGRRRSPISNYNDDDYYYNDNNDNNDNNNNNRNIYDTPDPYGFKKDSECKSQFTTISFKKILFYMMIFTVLSIFIFLVSLSGYIAWNEFLKDPIWIKILKTWLAIIFWPAYLTYSFFKSIIFNLNTNKMS